MLTEFKTHTQLALQNIIDNQNKLETEILVIKSTKCNDVKIDLMMQSFDALSKEINDKVKNRDQKSTKIADEKDTMNDNQANSKSKSQRKNKQKEKMLYLTDKIL